jgi:hypothetical protein
VVRVVFGKAVPEATDNFENVEQAASEFVDELNEELVILQRPTIENKFKSSIASPGNSSATSKAKSKSQEHTAFVNFAADGSVVGAKVAMLQEGGVTVGCRLQDPDDAAAVLEVQSISPDGDVKGMKVAEDGSLTRSELKMTAEDALAWIIVKSRVEYIDDWDAAKPEHNAAFVETIGKAYMAIAMSKLAMAQTNPKLKVQNKPTKSVYADDKFKKGSLCLVFETPKVQAIAADASIPPRALKVTLPHELGDKSMYLLPAGAENFVCPAWAVRSGAHPNMILKYKPVQISTSTDGHASKTVTLSMPCLVNSAPIVAGAELVVGMSQSNTSSVGSKRESIEEGSVKKVAKKAKM